MLEKQRGKTEDLWKIELQNLLSPKSIAVVGATENIGPGRNVIYNLLHMDFKGQIYPINPKRDQVFGLKCYKSLRELPVSPDAVTISVAAKYVLDIVKECEEIGVKACTILTSGFGEMGSEGMQLQYDIAKVAERAHIKLCGPNCLGHLDLNNQTGIYSASLPPGVKPGKVAVVSQSGSMAITMFQAFKNLGVGHVISYGNQAVLDLSDYLFYLSNDPNTQVITTFIEGIKDGKRFIESIKECRRKGKAIVALKIGKSPVSRHIALAHTASMVGSHDVYEEVFEEGKILEVSDIDEMLQTVTALVKTPPIQSKGIMLVAISGGQCGLIGDISSLYGLYFPEISENTKKEIAKIVPSYINISNPLDVSGVGSDNPEDYANVLRACAEDPSIGLILVSQDAPKGIGPSTIDHYSKIAGAVTEFFKEVRKPVVIFSNHSTPYEEEVMQYLIDSGVPYLQGTRESVAAVKHLVDYYIDSGFEQEFKEVPPDLQAKLEMAAAKALKLSQDKRFLGEREAKNILSMVGIPVTQDLLCESPDDVILASEKIGYPLAMKIDSPDIAHKTDAGGVALNIGSGDEARNVYRKILRTVRERVPDARIDGVMVQEMVPEGVDLIIGVHKDPQFGHVLVYGLGGIYVEVFKDSSIGLIPLSRGKARQMITKSMSYKLLKECRGRKALDIEPLIDIMIRLSEFVSFYGDNISEIDLNPVRIGTFGVKVLDALIVLNR